MLHLLAHSGVVRGILWPLVLAPRGRSRACDGYAGDHSPSRDVRIVRIAPVRRKARGQAEALARRRRALPGTLLDAQIGAVPEDELSIIGERETFTVAALTTVGWFLQLLFALSVWLAPAPDSPEPSTVVPGWTMIAQATLIALSVLFLYRYVEERARSLLAAASASTL